MGLCGSFRCGCGVTSTPAVEGAIDGELPSIVVSGSGEPGDPYNLTLNDAWAALVAAEERGSYTPALTNIAIGTGGAAQNVAQYTWVGGSDVGDHGILSVTQSLILGTSGASVTGLPTFGLPAGFNLDPATSSGTLRLGLATLLSSFIGAVQWNSASTVAVTALNASLTYLATTAVTSTIPGTWAAGDYIRAAWTAPAVRV